MAHLIDKDTLVAEIENIKSIEFNEGTSSDTYACMALDMVKEVIDTLEVKEVDLEKEIETHLKDCLDVKFPTTNIELIKKDVAYTAKKFFALGMTVSNKAQKREEV